LSLLGDKFHEKYTVYHQIKVPKKANSTTKSGDFIQLIDRK